MDQSVFMNKSLVPDEAALHDVLRSTFDIWKKIEEFVISKYPLATREWSFPGKKYGWSFRLKDKKRVIIYLLPRDGYFKAAFMFGQKATNAILVSGISESIKAELSAARVYQEGRGIKVDVNNPVVLHDIEKLVEIKIAD